MLGFASLTPTYARGLLRLSWRDMSELDPADTTDVQALRELLQHWQEGLESKPCLRAREVLGLESI